MGKLNAAWHEAHPMPKKPTTAERVAWHRAHAENCGCREMPPLIAKLIAEADADDSAKASDDARSSQG
ncbi:hypothetical protein E0K89_010070 [Aquicoccus sp. SCR17]|nr:hypothetical protein [Carideicomes alvinocaridis]